MTTIDMTYGPEKNDRPLLGGVYLLLAGLVAGFALGPWGMGQLRPQWYNAWFSDPIALGAELKGIAQTRRQLAMAGLTPEALTEYDTQRQAQVDAIHQQLDIATQWTDWMNALLLASIMVLMVMNLVLRDSRLFDRLHFGAHLLLGAWLALLLAQPHRIGALPKWGLAGALGLCVVVCVIPLRKSSAQPAENMN